MNDDTELVLQEVESLFVDLNGRPPRPVTEQSDLVGELGFDSLAMVELHDRLEQVFRVSLGGKVLATATTPADWVRAVAEARNRGPGPGGVDHPPARAAPVERAVRADRASSTENIAWPEDATTLTEGLAWHVSSHPDQLTVRLLGDEETSVEEISYRCLSEDASTVARGLVTEGLRRGDRVAIMLPTGRDYLATFLGTILAGGVPVPLYPAVNPRAVGEHLRQQSALIASAGATVLVAGREIRCDEPTLRSSVPSLRSVRCPEDLRESGRRRCSLPHLGADDIGLIQYTSGSTSEPKGVILTHREMLANMRALAQAEEATSRDVFVSWLPLYHDMGLIGAWLTSLFLGYPLVLLSPFQFLARPGCWLEAISEYSGTLSAAPNFAYQTCVDRISDNELDRLDLSSWRVAVDGSETVSASTIERFVDRFGRCGFRREAFSPAYGLAEVGVGLTLSPLGRGPRVDVLEREALQRSGSAVRSDAGAPGTVSVVGCGMAAPGYRVRVTDPRGDPLPERREGRIQCQGPSLTTGYFGNEAASEALWSNGWLETGDLGYLSDGELFITGRSKDLIIRGGRNIHPEDIERALDELDGVERGGVAVFASTDPRGTERMVAVVETVLEEPDRLDALRTAIARTAGAVSGTTPDQVVLVPVGSVVRTPSLKVRRAATRSLFEAGALTERPARTVEAVAPIGRTSPGARRVTRRAAQWSFGAYAWVVLVLVALPLWVLVELPLSRRLRWKLVRAAGRSLLALTGIDLRVEGSLPEGAPGSVVVANHASFVDGLAVALAVPDPVTFVTSSEMGDHRFVGSFLTRLGCVFVHRGEAGRAEDDVATMVALVRSGHHLVIFPEGSISPMERLRPFHLGAFATATATGCPIVPVGIRGTRDILRPGTYLAHRAPATVLFGPPVTPNGGGFDSEVELSRRTRSVVAQLVGEHE